MADFQPIISCHVVAMPYPGRGHINPMMNLCKLIASRRADILVTFIVTEEWLGFLGSEAKLPANIRFATIPNVIPSELVRAADISAFIEAISTKLQAPVERLLDRLEMPASVIIYDTFLAWVVDLGNRKKIPVASLWTMSATVFSVFYHYDLLAQNGHVQVNMSERGEEQVKYIPGVRSMRAVDLPTIFNGKHPELMDRALQAISSVGKAQYLLVTSIYELEARVVDALKAEFRIPIIYSIGPAIPYFNIQDKLTSPNDGQNGPDYVTWLDNQPKASVLYISQGSFLSVSSAQLDEIVAGVHESGVRFLWVARGEVSHFEVRNGGKGMIVPWCDQLKVLCHDSVGGFWSHCGWSSTKEGAFAGVPMLTFPIIMDQIPNSKMIVEDWKIGKRVSTSDEVLVPRGKISKLLRSFMDAESDERKEFTRRAKELKEICRQATAKGGSAETNIDAFISDISEVPGPISK